MENLVLLAPGELRLRLSKVQRKMREAGIDAILVADNANKYYLTGRVYAGYAFLPSEGCLLYTSPSPRD